MVCYVLWMWMCVCVCVCVCVLQEALALCSIKRMFTEQVWAMWMASATWQLWCGTTRQVTCHCHSATPLLNSFSLSSAKYLVCIQLHVCHDCVCVCVCVQPGSIESPLLQPTSILLMSTVCRCWTWGVWGKLKRTCMHYMYALRVSRVSHVLWLTYYSCVCVCV